MRQVEHLANAEPGETHAGERAEAGQQQGFGEHLARETPRAGAERGAHGKLALA
jgi:hypothetical protein